MTLDVTHQSHSSTNHSQLTRLTFIHNKNYNNNNNDNNYQQYRVMQRACATTTTAAGNNISRLSATASCCWRNHRLRSKAEFGSKVAAAATERAHSCGTGDRHSDWPFPVPKNLYLTDVQPSDAVCCAKERYHCCIRRGNTTI